MTSPSCPKGAKVQTSTSLRKLQNTEIVDNDINNNDTNHIKINDSNIIVGDTNNNSNNNNSNTKR